MALFQKKPMVSDSAPAYTIGATSTKLVVGLGNPSDKFAGNRHNLGYMAAEKFADLNDFPNWVIKKDLHAALTEKTMGSSRVLVLKPTTFMNDSGQAVQAVQRYFRIYNPDTVVVYDELALPFGQIRARVGGTDAGHNGVKSLISYIGDDFGRLRLGIGQVNDSDSAKFVLSNFSKTEQGSVDKLLAEACVMLSEYIFGGELPHDTRTIL